METISKTPKTLSHLPDRPQINIEFQDLSYSVPQGRKGTKLILRSVNGTFQSGQLTAILGPSGAGKSTLLNVLAGYRFHGASGTVTINGSPRNMRQFRALSRYIMQEDLLQPLLTVQEIMLVAADLKLSRELSHSKKLTAIAEILDMLLLSDAKDTPTEKLSGGQRKRLSIALELVNNPPVIFLDEPTSGLDDLSCSQCISLLKLLAAGGRTVVCSVHSPSARLFAMFDHVYILAAGQCVYQGRAQDTVPFLRGIGLDCPIHYNPADFIIEVVSGEYGAFLDKMVSLTENGRSYQKIVESEKKELFQTESDSANQNEITCDPIQRGIFLNRRPKYDSTGWLQFKILAHRMILQTQRNRTKLFLNIFLYLFLGIIIGLFYFNMGNDGSKTLFNFAFCFTSIIVFMYCPLLPVLLNFPIEVQLIKREYFNRWYNLYAYFFAMSVVNIPIQLSIGLLYLVIVYILTNQPLELQRIVMFFSICLLVAQISESVGIAVSSTLNILNGMFVGSTLTVPLMLLAVYGIGAEVQTNIPVLVKFAMSLSYLRYGMEGLIAAIYGGDRPNLPCPKEEEYCFFVSPSHFMAVMGMGNVIFWFDLCVLFAMLILMKATSFYLLRQRLAPNKTFAALHLIGRLIKSHMSGSR